MTKEEAKNIPELQIHPNDFLEDCFYYKMAKAGKLSDTQGCIILERLKGMENDPLYQACMLVADIMIENIEKYGVACIDWCE